MAKLKAKKSVSIESGKIIKTGQEFEVDEKTAEHLIGLGAAERLMVRAEPAVNQEAAKEKPAAPQGRPSLTRRG